MSNKQAETDDIVFEGRIAQIIDDHRIVINKGHEHGVRVGQRFLILAIGDEIFDPETDESLGQVEVVKGRGKVTHVQEKMSTLQTTENHEITRNISNWRLKLSAENKICGRRKHVRFDGETVIPEPDVIRGCPAAGFRGTKQR